MASATARYATSPTAPGVKRVPVPPRLQGALKKQKRKSKLLGNWNTRWFVVDAASRSLLYYQNQGASKPSGGVSLDSITAIRRIDACTFSLDAPTRSFVLKAAGPATAEVWYSGLEGYFRDVGAYDDSLSQASSSPPQALVAKKYNSQQQPLQQAQQAPMRTPLKSHNDTTAVAVAKAVAATPDNVVKAAAKKEAARKQRTAGVATVPGRKLRSAAPPAPTDENMPVQQQQRHAAPSESKHSESKRQEQPRAAPAAKQQPRPVVKESVRAAPKAFGGEFESSRRNAASDSKGSHETEVAAFKGVMSPEMQRAKVRQMASRRGSVKDLYDSKPNEIGALQFSDDSDEDDCLDDILAATRISPTGSDSHKEEEAQQQFGSMRVSESKQSSAVRFEEEEESKHGNSWPAQRQSAGAAAAEALSFHKEDESDKVEYFDDDSDEDVEPVQVLSPPSNAVSQYDAGVTVDANFVEDDWDSDE